MNKLSDEKAAYLKHSASQRIEWYPWGDEPFERAAVEDKPVFLSSGAIWCHWCHVMAEESFDDDEVVRLLNEHCINIKLDRDERPEIDRIYQQAVAAMGSGGGWPLSVFLTPDRKPFFGGTYFPLEDTYGRPGFKKVIKSVVDFYKSRRGEVLEYAEKLVDFLQPKQIAEGVINEEMLTGALKDILDEFDPGNGGFGKSPKFPMAGALEFLINRHYFASRKKDLAGTEDFPLETTDFVINKTLGAMAKGGFHDHLGGGFHRYSVDEAWLVPHFEKMADDNAWLLRNYVDAYCLFGDEQFKEISKGIIRFVRDTLSDPEGGFFASQDADVTPDDEGGYFTWRDEDLRKSLTEEEYAVLSSHLFHEGGAMHHDKAKKVLSVAMKAEEIAAEMGMEKDVVAEIIARGKEKLLKQRGQRVPPFIDASLYTSLNGMLISAFLKAYRGLKDPYAKEFALKSLRRVMDLRYIGGELFHAEGVRALLDDYVHLIDALIAAYEITGDPVFNSRADELMEKCLAGFWDEGVGGFFNSADDVAGVRLKVMEDIPHPSANALAIVCLLKLSYINDKDIYWRHAETMLKSFSPGAKDLGIHSAYYYSAMDKYFNMFKLNLEVDPLGEIADAARLAFNPYMTLAYGEDKGFVVPCRKGACYEAIDSVKGLVDFLSSHP
jgi:uncharacterized protein YyaL (SSP411 family)